jgi:hypothetical protein
MAQVFITQNEKCLLIIHCRNFKATGIEISLICSFTAPHKKSQKIHQ